MVLGVLGALALVVLIVFWLYDPWGVETPAGHTDVGLASGEKPRGPGHSMLAQWTGPTGLAILFALLSWPLVTLTLGAVDTSSGVTADSGGLPATTELGQWTAAASAAFVSAAVAGTIGGPVVR